MSIPLSSPRIGRRATTFALAAALLVTAACGGSDEAATPDTTASTEAAAETSAPETTEAPSEVAPTATDGAGNTIELDAPAEKVVCITEACVDALAEVGMTPAAIAPNRLAGEPEFFGADAESIPTIGGSFFEPSIEDIVANEPDLVIGLAGVHEAVADALGDIPLFIVKNDSPEAVAEFMRSVGALTGTSTEAEAAATRFEDKLAAAVEARTDDAPSVVIAFAGAYGFNIDGTGASSAYSEMLSRVADYPFASADAASQEGGFATFSVEQLLDVDPDVVFVATIGEMGQEGDPIETVMEGDAVWAELSAVQNDKVVQVRTPVWLYGRGTRSLGIVLDEFAAATE